MTTQKKKFHLAMRPDVAKRLKILAIAHDVYPGDVIEAGLLALELSTPAARAALLASLDDRAGHIVEGGDERVAVAEDRAEQAVRAAEIDNEFS